MMEAQIGKFIANLFVYAGSAALIAFGLFKTLGEKWMDTKFAQRLKTLEHGYAIELSKLKQRLDTAASGISRLHQKESEVLPEAWGLLDEAMNTLRWVISPLQSYPNLKRMNDEEWEEFIDEISFLGNPDKKYLRGISGNYREKEYRRIYDGYKNGLAEKAIREFQKYSARNSIFLPENLRSQFDRIRELLWSASVSKNVGREVEDWKMQQEAWEQLQKEVEPLFVEIRRSIQERIAQQSSFNIEGLNASFYRSEMK